MGSTSGFSILSTGRFLQWLFHPSTILFIIWSFDSILLSIIYTYLFINTMVMFVMYVNNRVDPIISRWKLISHNYVNVKQA